MSVTKRELEVAAHNHMFRAQRAEQKAADTSHALNLLLNGSFHALHTGLTEDGAVHEFLLGVVRNVPVTKQFGWPVPAGQTENRRIILWKTTFEPRECTQPSITNLSSGLYPISLTPNLPIWRRCSKK